MHSPASRQDSTFTLCFWTFCVLSFPVMKGSTPLDNAAVSSLPCVWLFTHNIINKNAKEILHSKIDFKRWQSILSSKPFTGDLCPTLTYSTFLYLNCLCTFFSLCWSNKINSFWYGDGFAAAKTKDWSPTVPFGEGWKWAKHYWVVEWEWPELGTQTIDLCCWFPRHSSV